MTLTLVSESHVENLGARQISAERQFQRVQYQISHQPSHSHCLFCLTSTPTPYQLFWSLQVVHLGLQRLVLLLKAMISPRLLLSVSFLLGMASSYTSTSSHQRPSTILSYADYPNTIPQTADAASTVRFEQNSQLMYDVILERTPAFIRSVTKNNLDTAIADLGLQVVTESNMYDVVKKATPKPFLKHGLLVLDEHRSPEVSSTTTFATAYEVEDEEYIDYSANFVMINDRNLNFEQNSKLMYDKVLEGHPILARRVVQRNLNRAITKKCTEKVTERDMYQIIKQESPKALLEYNLMILDKHCTGLSLEKHFTEGSVVNSSVEVVEDRVIIADGKEVATKKLFVIGGKEYDFQQNARIMYDMTLEGTPSFIRKVTKDNLDSAILKLCEDVVSEEDMYDVVTEATPKPFREFIMCFITTYISFAPTFILQSSHTYFS